MIAHARRGISREARKRSVGLDPSKLSASMVKTVLVITGKAKAWRPERAGLLQKAMDALTSRRRKAGCRAAIE